MKADSDGIHEQRGHLGGSCLALGIYFIFQSGFSLQPSPFSHHTSAFVFHPLFADFPMVYLARREEPRT
jgi:hypothetical protein